MVSAGGANPVEGYWLSHGFSVFISNGKAINPITGTNWEKVGVKPDIEVPAVEAPDRAYAEALQLMLNRIGADEQGKVTGLLDIWAGGHTEWSAR